MFIQKIITCVCVTFFSVSVSAQTYDLIVAANGSGNYTTVQAAINAVPSGQIVPYRIFIKNGKYREKITVPSTKTFVQLIGESVANTILFYDDASANAGGTSASGSFTVSANDFSAFNITFSNTYDYDAGVAAGVAGTQAVAVVINGDRSAFKNCRFHGNQDTLYSNKKAYFKNCYIDGIVDFIFGGGANIYDSCTIYPKTRTTGGSSYITAANTPSGQAYGYVFRDSKIIGNPGGTNYVMGRPWQNSTGSSTPYAENKVVMINTILNSNISAAGWSTWDAGTNTALITYAEYQSKYFDGSAVPVNGRVSWSQQFNSTQAATYSNANVLAGWDPCTVYAGMCSAAATEIAVSNFIGTKGVGTANFKWNLSWGINQVKFEIFRSLIRSGTYTKIGEVTSANDTTYNHSFLDNAFPPGQQVYYYLVASKAGQSSHNTDTLMLSTKPTISVNAALGSFQQGGGLPSASQTYTVNGVNLSDNIIITPPVNYEISINNTSWVTSSNSITLLQTNGVVANTTIYARQNAASAPGSFTSNILHTTVNGDNVLVAVNGTSQVAALTPAAFFRSRVTGVLNDVATWETSSDSTTWFAASTTPTGAAEENITIMPTHTVSINVPHAVNGKWTVYGTGSNSGGALSITTGSLSFANNSNLVWNRDGGTLPAATVFNAGSTFSITGTGNGSATSQLPGITATTVFHHVIINAPNCKASNPSFSGNLNTINGNLTILSTGIISSKIRFLNGATQVANIAGDLIINPPLGNHVTFVLYATSTVATAEAVNIGGNILVNNNFSTNITGTTGTFVTGSIAVTLSSANPAIIVGMGVTGTGIASGSYVTAINGTSLTLNANTTAAGTTVALTFVQATANLQLTDNNGTNSQTNVKGNITFNTATLSNSGTGLGTINVNRTDGIPQIYTRNAGSVSGNATWNVMANAVFDVGTSTLPGAAFNLNSGTTLRSSSATGILGNITAGIKNFSSGANYIFNGVSAQTTLNNFTATTPTANQVNNLTINNAAGVTLGNSLTVSNSTTLTNGKLTLGAINLITNSITGSANSYAITNAAGVLKINNVGAINTLFPVGISATSYTPVTINNSGTADNYSVRISAGAPAGINVSPQSDSSINTTWNISEDIAGGSNAAVTLQWNTADQNSLFSNNNCAVVHSNGTSIDYAGLFDAATNISSGVYSRIGTGFTSFSPFGVTSKPSSVLPLSLLSFEAAKENKNVRLKWTTSNEINVKKFVVERTIDLLKFDAIHEVVANGTAANNYTDVDENPTSGISYYRLKIIDNNGQFYYSKIVKVFFANTKELFVSPNPVTNTIHIEHAIAGKTALFVIYTMDGKQVAAYSPAAFTTQTNFITNLVAGTYILSFTNNGVRERTLIIKK